MNSFFTREELMMHGFQYVGENVLVSRKASIYGADAIELGHNVRIDDFCILSGKIHIGSYVHIAAYSALYGGDIGICIEDFGNISSRVSIYAISDDYSGFSMTNPLVPDKYKQMTKGKILIGKHVIIGSGCVVLPGVSLSEGSAFGALSMIKKDSEPWSINAGIPARFVKRRSDRAKILENNFIAELKAANS